MTCKVAIGSRWEPKYFEHRTPMTYSSKNPYMDRDSAALQRALLRNSRFRPARRALRWAVAATAIVAIFIVSFT